MKKRAVWRRAGWLTAMLLAGGCTQPADGPAASGQKGPGETSATPAGSSKPTAPGGAQGPRATRPLLAPDERRAALFVVPGDALVEVDGQLAGRRNGVVELVGKPGEVRRVRVFKGAKSTPEKAVTIQENGASPAFLDLNEPAAPQAASGPQRPPPTRFSFDE